MKNLIAVVLFVVGVVGLINKQASEAVEKPSNTRVAASAAAEVAYASLLHEAEAVPPAQQKAKQISAKQKELRQDQCQPGGCNSRPSIPEPSTVKQQTGTTYYYYSRPRWRGRWRGR